MEKLRRQAKGKAERQKAAGEGLLNCAHWGRLKLSHLR